jgi:hypothetical protein
MPDTPRLHVSTMLAFDAHAADEFGGEWVHPLEPVVSLADLGRRRPSGASDDVLSWELVRRAILAVRAAR